MIKDLWYKNAVVYCLSVETFMDSNGDGCGDFEGLARRLDYLHGLGITTLWLMPFQTSPGRDDGYDVSDYYNVDARYGTLGDFVEFTHAAEQRGMRVLIDLVVNHTSDQHPWFRAARSSRTSPYRDFYVWRASEPPSTTKAPMNIAAEHPEPTRDRIGAGYIRRRAQPSNLEPSSYFLIEISSMSNTSVPYGSRRPRYASCSGIQKRRVSPSTIS